MESLGMEISWRAVIVEIATFFWDSSFTIWIDIHSIQNSEIVRESWWSSSGLLRGWLPVILEEYTKSEPGTKTWDHKTNSSPLFERCHTQRYWYPTHPSCTPIGRKWHEVPIGWGWPTQRPRLASFSRLICRAHATSRRLYLSLSTALAAFAAGILSLLNSLGKLTKVFNLWRICFGAEKTRHGGFGVTFLEFKGFQGGRRKWLPLSRVYGGEHDWDHVGINFGCCKSWSSSILFTRGIVFQYPFQLFFNISLTPYGGEENIRKSHQQIVFRLKPAICSFL